MCVGLFLLSMISHAVLTCFSSQGLSWWNNEVAKAKLHVLRLPFVVVAVAGWKRRHVALREVAPRKITAAQAGLGGSGYHRLGKAGVPCCWFAP